MELSLLSSLLLGIIQINVHLVSRDPSPTPPVCMAFMIRMPSYPLFPNPYYDNDNKDIKMLYSLIYTIKPTIQLPLRKYWDISEVRS